MIHSSTYTIPPPTPPNQNHLDSTIRSTNLQDTSNFITNVQTFPTQLPTSWPPLQTHNSTTTNLIDWENSLGNVGRTLGQESSRRRKFRENDQGVWSLGEKWVMEFPYSAAVDGDLYSAWRSIDGQSFSLSFFLKHFKTEYIPNLIYSYKHAPLTSNFQKRLHRYNVYRWYTILIITNDKNELNQISFNYKSFK